MWWKHIPIICLLFIWFFPSNSLELRNRTKITWKENNRTCRTSKYFRSIIVISFGFSLSPAHTHNQRPHDKRIEDVISSDLFFFRFRFVRTRSGSMVTFSCHWFHRWVFFYWGNFFYSSVCIWMICDFCPCRNINSPVARNIEILEFIFLNALLLMMNFPEMFVCWPAEIEKLKL